MSAPTQNHETTSNLRLLRVVGPPGAGKTYLITLLIEELRPLGHFVATSAPRSEAVTVITTSSGARITLEHTFNQAELCRLVASLDPRATLLLAESLDAPGTPAIEVIPDTAHTIKSSDTLASVHSSGVAPGALAPLAQHIDRWLRGLPEERQGILPRLFRGRK